MKKGFTLLELLIVIGILAILATAAVLVLNPAELLRQARDSTRIADIAGINSALGLYITDATTIDLDGSAVVGTTPIQGAGERFVCAANKWTTYAAGFAATTSIGDLFVTDGASTSLRTTGGLGWIPVNFDGLSVGSPLPTLPIDPSSTADRNYSYGCIETATVLTYELNARLESVKFTTGSDPKQTNDGGDNVNFFEAGTDPGLDL